MDEAARQQILLILDDADDRLKRAVGDRLKASRAAAPGIRGGAALYVPKIVAERARTVIAATVDAMEDEGSKYVTSCVSRVKAVAMDLEAFAMIEERLEVSLQFFAKRLEGVTLATLGSAIPGQLGAEARKAGLALFAASRRRLVRQLAIHRFSFAVPYGPPSTAIATQPALAKSRGGKPLAAHWDEMWAAIAVALFRGHLEPETQADIERAMQDWFASENIDVAASSVRTRAQKLWRKLKESE